MSRHAWIAALPLALAAGAAPAEIIEETVVYEVDGQSFEGHFARNTGFGDGQPLVLIIHDWDGPDGYERRRARMLAEQGYAAFAADLYGQGVRPETTEERRERSGELYADRETMRARLEAGLAEARARSGVDPERVAAIGYCFGGAAVLELARSGADLAGFVSFHGGLATPEGQDYEAVRGPILVLHGSADASVPMSDIATLAGALDDAGAEHAMEIYGGVDHAFTVWDEDRYDAKADVMSWAAMLEFFDSALR